MPTEEDAIKRVMPHSTEAEMSVVGAMLLDQAAIGRAQEYLEQDDFYSRQYGIMFQTMLELDRVGMAVDPVTLQEKLKEQNLPPEIYSAEALSAILAQVPTSANIVSYAKIVADKSRLRRLIRANEELAAKAYEGTEPVDSLMSEAQDRIFKLATTRSDNDYVPISRIVLNAMERVEMASKVHGSVTGVATGFTELDNRTAGMQPADLILLAARPSMGKTALALNIAHNVAVKNHQHVAIFSLEMSKEQLVNRLFSMESHVDAQKIRTGDLSDGEWGDLIESAGVIGNSGLILDDTPAISVAAMRSKCLKYKLDMGLDMVMVDYLQLMSSSSTRSTDSRQQEISDISRSLKSLARELKVPIIALSQLSRAVESRTDKRPMLSDLRESGAIEQDADVVMFIYRDEYYHPDTDSKGIAEVIIAKQRNGPVGTVQLAWLGELTKFANLASQSQSFDGE